MNSSIFNFRTLAIAAVLVALIEGVCALSLRPSFVDRADLGLLDLFEDDVIFGKLGHFADSSPDVIQVGDSSGFHGVRPELVMPYLSGLKYLNLNCCASMGYRGYYAAADFMLRRNPGIKAVVLYVTLNGLPSADLVRGDYQMGEYIQDSLTSPFAYLAPPTLALRQTIANQIKLRRLTRNQAVYVTDMQQSTRRHLGWWAEHDRRLAPSKRAEYWREFCGQSGNMLKTDSDVFYGQDILRGRYSYMRSELQRFASLAADHGAKFVLAFHPFPCRGLEGSFMAARRDDLDWLLKHNPHMAALPEQMFTPWPTERFVSSGHLHTGYDAENSRRLGRLLSKALGLIPAEAAATRDASEPAANDPGVVRPLAIEWRSEGSTFTQGGTAGESTLVEAAGPGIHRIDGKLAGLTPGTVAVLSFPARAIGARGVFIELEMGSQSGGGFCDLVGETATRERDMLDTGIDMVSDQARCWVAMTVTDTAAMLRLSLLDQDLAPSYVGDGRSGVAIGGIELRETAHFLQGESSPW
jgi:hypothetical protein